MEEPKNLYLYEEVLSVTAKGYWYTAGGGKSSFGYFPHLKDRNNFPIYPDTQLHGDHGGQKQQTDNQDQNPACSHLNLPNKCHCDLCATTLRRHTISLYMKQYDSHTPRPRFPLLTITGNILHWLDLDGSIAFPMREATRDSNGNLQSPPTLSC